MARPRVTKGPCVQTDHVAMVSQALERLWVLGSVSAVADEMGISSPTLTRYAADLGLNLRAWLRQRRVNVAREMYNGGHSMGEIGEAIGTNADTASRYVRDLLPRKPDDPDAWDGKGQNGKDLGGELPELDADDRPRLENFLRNRSPLAEAEWLYGVPDAD